MLEIGGAVGAATYLPRAGILRKWGAGARLDVVGLLSITSGTCENPHPSGESGVGGRLYFRPLQGTL
jgi:hypothetical protein